MKLNINRASDLSSISVLPAHSRRAYPISSGVDSSGSVKMRTYHVRSQSQQPCSQGTSLSQLSQSSLDDFLTNEQRFDSQERDSTAKRLSCLAPVTNSRDESQMQQLRSSNYATRRWTSAFTPDPRCHINEELESRIGLMENSLNRLEKTMDSVQSDLMQVNKVVKEVSLEVAGIWQKIIIQDGHMQLMLKGEEDIKASTAESLKSFPDQLRKNTESADQQKLHKVVAAISSLPTRIEACLLRLQNEICGTFTKEIEKRSCINVGSGNNQLPVTGIVNGQPVHHIWVPDLDMEAEIPKALKPKTRVLSSVKHSMQPKREVLLTELMNDFRVITESDEETDGGFSCLLKKDKADGKCYLQEGDRKESMRILRKARKARRKRKLDNTILLD